MSSSVLNCSLFLRTKMSTQNHICQMFFGFRDIGRNRSEVKELLETLVQRLDFQNAQILKGLDTTSHKKIIYHVCDLGSTTSARSKFKRVFVYIGIMTNNWHQKSSWRLHRRHDKLFLYIVVSKGTIETFFWYKTGAFGQFNQVQGFQKVLWPLTYFQVYLANDTSDKFVFLMIQGTNWYTAQHYSCILRF